jgi:hypothetical protein
MWRGFAIKPASRVNMALIQPFLDHIKNVICSGNEEAYQFELQKNGWIVQNPNVHLGFATVLLSDEGTGKNVYTDMLCSLWGSDYSEPNISSMETVTCDTHAEAIAYKKIIVLNEAADQADSKASFNVMKSRISDHTYRVRSLYQPLREVRNVNNYFIVSNNDAVKLGTRDRRYYILEVSDCHLQDIPYFEELCDTFTDEMRSHLLKFFLDISTKGFEPKRPPMTDIKAELQECQKPLAQMFMEKFDWVDAGGYDHTKDGMLIDDIYTDGFLPYCAKFKIEQKYIPTPGAGFGRKIKPYVRQKTIIQQRFYFPLEEEPVVAKRVSK